MLCCSNAAVAPKAPVSHVSNTVTGEPQDIMPIGSLPASTALSPPRTRALAGCDVVRIQAVGATLLEVIALKRMDSTETTKGPPPD